MDTPHTDFYSVPLADLLQQLQAGAAGLTGAEAQARLARYGPNRAAPKAHSTTLGLLLSQFSSPIILILLFAVGLSFFLADDTDAIIILVIVLASGLLGFWQEHGATNAVAKLLAMVQIKTRVVRDGAALEVPVEDVVPGDVVVLSAGDVIPGDARLIDSKDLFADEAVLTGETFPVEKTAGELPADTALARRTNTLFMGTHVVSGSGTAVIVLTGAGTQFGQISQRLKLRPPETEFEHGVRHFGYLLMEITLLMVVAIFAVNVYLARPVLDSLLFALALAVGLTPQLLPAIISVNLAHGAQEMARQKVIVKRLAAIENFGSMNVLCSDKTGTLTEGEVKLHAALDVNGKDSEQVLLYAYLNATYQSGFVNPIDEAIHAYRQFDLTGYAKLDEVPYDFIRKRLSVLVAAPDGRHLLITKGAATSVMAICSSAARPDSTIKDLVSAQPQLEQTRAELSSQGFRTLGVAYRDLGAATTIKKEDETGLTLAGLVVLFDPPKAGVVETIGRLKDLGVTLKIITGDNRLVAHYVGETMGLPDPQIVTGADLHVMSDAALLNRVGRTDIFAEVEPNHKERIIIALRKAGNVVGYIGDGINDASAIHAADVGISVMNAVDVAKEAADIVLLERDLAVLIGGVQAGRVTFMNTLKYVFMASSANFGNMFSMAGASLLLPFLPLLPQQILLTNLLTDFPEMTIATDTVDTEWVARPRRWDVKFIRNFMLIFGPLSSVFDFLTFGVLLFLFHAGPALLRSGWFVESVVSACLVVLIVRTRQPFFRSRPSRYLLGASLAVIVVAVILPFTPVGALVGFAPLPATLLVALAVIVALYVTSAELAKSLFYRLARF
jgi:P-type Mg2+ transporter